MLEEDSEHSLLILSFELQAIDIAKHPTVLRQLTQTLMLTRLQGSQPNFEDYNISMKSTQKLPRHRMLRGTNMRSSIREVLAKFVVEAIT